MGLDPTASSEGVKQLPQWNVSNVGPLANRLVARFLCHTLPQRALTDKVQKPLDATDWTPIARRVGAGAWDTLGTGSVILDGIPSEGKISVQVGGQPLVSGEPPLQLRLEVRAPVSGG